MKILIINKQVPQPDRASGCKRLYAILELLSVDNQIYYFAESECKQQEYVVNLEKLGVSVIHGEWRRLIKVILNTQFDVIIYEFYHTAHKYMSVLKIIQENALSVIDSVDVHFNRIKGEVDIGLISSRYYCYEKKREIAAYLQADLVIVVSDEDGIVLKEQNVKNNITISNIVPIRNRSIKDRGSPVILFVGGFKHLPNVYAVEWFLKNSWGLIKAKVPNICFHIVGGDLPKELEEMCASLMDVSYLGYVHSLDGLYDSATVAVAPLTYGGGVKGKVNEAMAYGIPLVTTSIGVQGIPAVDAVHCFIADDPVQFSEKVIRLVNDADLQQRFTKESSLLADKTCGTFNAKNQISKLIGLSYGNGNYNENAERLIHSKMFLAPKIFIKVVKAVYGLFSVKLHKLILNR